VRVTRLAHGIAVGTELEYADRSSVARALEHRREL
jgi:recombinational DNA repair protein RecR